MLYDYVKSKGYNDNFVEWEDLKSFISNEYIGLDKSENDLDDKKIRVVSKLQIKLSEDELKEKNISFNSLIDMVSNSSNKKYYLHGIGITTEDFRKLKSLRNMIHLEKSEDSKTSFHKFKYEVLDSAKDILYKFLNYNKFYKDEKLLDIYDYLEN